MQHDCEASKAIKNSSNLYFRFAEIPSKRHRNVFEGSITASSVLPIHQKSGPICNMKQLIYILVCVPFKNITHNPFLTATHYKFISLFIIKDNSRRVFMCSSLKEDWKLLCESLVRRSSRLTGICNVTLERSEPLLYGSAGRQKKQSLV